MSSTNPNGDAGPPPPPPPAAAEDVTPLEYASGDGRGDAQPTHGKRPRKESVGQAMLIGCLTGLVTAGAIVGLAYWLATLATGQ